MKNRIDQLKTKFREKLEADPSFSGIYRGKVMQMLDAAIHEVFDTFRGDRG